MSFTCKQTVANKDYDLRKFEALKVLKYNCVAHVCNIVGKHETHWCKYCGSKWK